MRGKIVLSLIGGFWGLGDYPKRFSELKWILDVSDPGLAKALKDLRRGGVIERDDERRYYVKPELRTDLGNLLRSLYSHFLLERTHLIAEQLQRFNSIVSIVVFGSVAQGKADYGSDVDLLVIVDEWNRSVERRINTAISRLTVKMGIPVEQIVISNSGFENLLHHELQFLFGLLEGYIVLYDKGDVTELLHLKEDEIKKEYEYVKEIPIWIPRVR
ncbi:MAG: nucleotidyltransferase domain-containing protein [Thermoproteota archaeon]|nr:nucleotidyltransferase domain-containing protein [Thermoproteota archaeon]